MSMWRTMDLQEGVPDFHRSFFRKIGFDWCENLDEVGRFINSSKGKGKITEVPVHGNFIHNINHTHLQHIEIKSKMGHVVIIGSGVASLIKNQISIHSWQVSFKRTSALGCCWYIATCLLLDIDLRLCRP